MEEEEEKQKLQNDIRILTERLAKVNESLSKKMAARNEFDKTIAETEGAYMKVRFQDRVLRFILAASFISLPNDKLLTHFHSMIPFDALGNKPFENTVGKGEIARKEQFPLSHSFLPVWITFWHFCQI